MLPIHATLITYLHTYLFQVLLVNTECYIENAPGPMALINSIDCAMWHVAAQINQTLVTYHQPKLPCINVPTVCSTRPYIIPNNLTARHDPAVSYTNKRPRKKGGLAAQPTEALANNGKERSERHSTHKPSTFPFD